MIYYFSELTKQYKDVRNFRKWVDERVKQAKENAYENRDVIYKNDIAHELKRIERAEEYRNLYKSLAKKSSLYDIKLKIDRKGYNSYDLIFPFLDGERDKCYEYYMKKREEFGKDAWFCVRKTECYWEIVGERMKKLLPNCFLMDNGGFEILDKERMSIHFHIK